MSSPLQTERASEEGKSARRERERGPAARLPLLCQYTEKGFPFILCKLLGAGIRRSLFRILSVNWVSRPRNPSFAKMATALLTSLLLSLILGSSFSHAWSQVELDLFDLVEEVNENFYDFLHIPQVKKNMTVIINIYNNNKNTFLSFFCLRMHRQEILGNLIVSFPSSITQTRTGMTPMPLKRLEK